MGTTAKYVVLAVSIETVLGLVLALLVSRELRFAGPIRVGLILPMTIAPVVVGVIWRLMYASDIGVVNPLFEAFGLPAPNVLAHGTSAFIGLVVVDVWEWTPLIFLIILAGLQSLPQEPLEAARVDGAGRVRLFLDHTLPLLRPVLLVAIVLRTIDAIGTFDQIFVLTRGGPGRSTAADLDLRLQHRVPVHPVRRRDGDAAIAARGDDRIDDRSDSPDAARGRGCGGMTRRAPRSGRLLRRDDGDPAGRPLPVLVDDRHVAEAAGRHLLRRRALAPAGHLVETTSRSFATTTSAST